MTSTITLEPLTAEAFKPYGDVIATADRDYFMINNGSTRRYHQLANVDTEGGSAIISIFQATPLVYPLSVTMMERHPLGSQAFIPLLGNAYLILVAAPTRDLNSDRLDSQTIRGFISDGSQGVNYHKGVWHHPILALTDQDQFLVVDRAGSGNNCEEVHFSDAETRVLEIPVSRL
ncbi:ureidoglycolate lyase [Moritella sp. 24]|uniref:ureidoglycolate lyase n=1 Tax=Moritella sp. 24 TaxID=2746230 RepID=UPI001BAA8EB6|nr:ureidoglycolate lyase [Moritella sp. 24]QUM78519.1 ureidoglycolate lyase [Moritella sp. 24]